MMIMEGCIVCSAQVVMGYEELARVYEWERIRGVKYAWMKENYSFDDTCGMPQ
jgi:hypothetical protein